MAKKDEIEILRPRENPDLFGHEAAEQRFVNEFTRGTPHHAYLISGPKGIGKATLAYRLARYILRTGAVTAQEAPSMSLFGDEPAPAKPAATGLQMDVQDPLFRRVALGSHTDLLALAPAYDPKKGSEKNSISVEDARKVPEFLSLTPAEGEWRVVIIDAVNQLNTQAANALLKTIEEPPPRAILLIVCHELGSILPTIRSRCRNFALTPPNKNDFGKVISTVAPHIENHEYAALYALSYGSPGLAITLAQHKGLTLYEGWLNALRPGAPAEAAGFASGAANAKSPDAWLTLLHAWQVALHRISLYPNYAVDQPIFQREGEYLKAVAESIPPAQRAYWQASARQLLGATEVFNLDKKETIRLMLDPARIIARFPAAA